MAKCIMIQGTMSGAGKSLLTAALCRIFHQDGLRVAPFKSQNMALNSCITADGLEMGRAQAVQAYAAGKEPDVRMNPILLKPSSDMGSQLIVNGRVRGQYEARDYFRMKKSLIPEILNAYESLAKENDVIVIEGAGSPAEINLRQDDIVNMGLAELVNAPVLLAGDIDRGGVFAQLYGTIALLQEQECARVIGTIINKFRGDVEILRPGLFQLEELTGIPVLGVVPYLPVDIDEEDSLSEKLSVKEHGKPIDIAVIRFPHISNYTDFAPLEHHPMLGIRYVQHIHDLQDHTLPDLIILPGTKNTMDDLRWMKETGLYAAILRLHNADVPVLGICGGFQMLGISLADPMGIESKGTASEVVRGLGLLPCSTRFSASKTRTRIQASILAKPFSSLSVDGYEIHMGITSRESAGKISADGRRVQPFALLEDGREDGLVCENVFGTYLHGIFDNGRLTEALAKWLLKEKGLENYSGDTEVQTHRQYLDCQFDLLAAEVRKSLDMETIRNRMRDSCFGRREISVKSAGGSAPSFLQKPADIEVRSMKIISQELNSMGFTLPAENAPVIRRVIHASADFSYAQTMYFSARAVSYGIDALKNGTILVTDTNMAKTGISRKGLELLSSRAVCFMADPDIAEAARKAGTTRAVCAIQKAAGLYPSAIYVTGNAPTALFALVSLIEKGMRPSLVIAVPVGFVNVVEAKEAIVSCCKRFDIPVIAAMGRKGGSTIAAAICNALIYMAADMEDPSSR